MSARPPLPDSALHAPALLLGVALGGFFDGILLHQILQWHHLLSNVEGAGDLRLQVLADGLFHALMFVVAAMALGWLWRRRAAVERPRAGRRLLGHVLIGFGAWHGLDAVLSHWVLGIHRIRMDAAEPLWWDLGWLAVFGLLPALLGWWLRRAAGSGPGAGAGPRAGSHGREAAVALAVTLLVAAAWVARPAGAGNQVMVLFAPGVTPAAAFNALARADARVVWVDRSGSLWAVAMDDRSRAGQLYTSGALLVSSSLVALGCLGWAAAP